MDQTPAVDRSVVMAASLRGREITELAETYRQWRDVLSAAVHTIAAIPGSASAHRATRIHEALASNGDPVPPSDLEDAAMAIWLHAASRDVERPDATTELLREPWRTFEARRSGNELALV